MIRILAPVGNFAMLASAISAGADEVYFGVKELNMRANAKNFELFELREVVVKCHENNVKANLTLNTVLYEGEYDKLDIILKAAKDAGVDAVICWDLAVLQKAKELGFEIHLSTQASVSNFESLKFFSSHGVKRFILARELSLAQIKKIKYKMDLEAMDAELEVFIHGAMCVATSGRCFTSQFLYNKSANRGDCLQPCRRRYRVTDLETDKELVLDNNFVMSAKDLCTIMIFDKILDSGVDVLKIEGRGRSPEYVKTVVEVYKQAIEAHKEKNLTKELKSELFKKLQSVYNRKFSTGFFLGRPSDRDFADNYGSAATQKKVFVGIIKHFYNKLGVAEVELQANPLKLGDKLLVQGPSTGSEEQTLISMQIDHKDIAMAKKGEFVAIKFDFVVRENDNVFKVLSK